MDKLSAIYENGVFHPSQPVNLAERQRVTLFIAVETAPMSDDSWRDTDIETDGVTDVEPEPSLAAVRAALAKLPGSLPLDFLERVRKMTIHHYVRSKQ